MDPTVFERYLEAARRYRVEAFEVSQDGALRVSLGPALPEAPKRPRGLRETQARLAEVDEDVLYGSSGGDQ